MRENLENINLSEVITYVDLNQLKRSALKGDRINMRKISRMLYLFSIIVAISIICVWIRITCVKLNYKLINLKATDAQVKLENERLKFKKASLKSPERIERIAFEKLNLKYPEKEQLIIKFRQ